MENYIKNFGAWTNISEAAETDQFANQAESIMTNPARSGSILKCIEGKPALKKLADISIKALFSSIVMGIAGYLVVQTGGLAAGAATALAGYVSGTELERLNSLDWTSIDKENKSCEACIKRAM